MTIELLQMLDSWKDLDDTAKRGVTARQKWKRPWKCSNNVGV